MTSLRFLPALLAASAVFSIAPLASAIVAPQSDPVSTGCASNQECGRGYECTLVGTSGCASAACAPGQACPDPAPCVVTEEHACTPAHCATDADCADGMLCHEWTEPGATSTCNCGPNTDCACPPSSPTPPTTVKMCTPRYVLPCTTASDCGDGFTCQEAQSCACAGSSGSSGGTPAPEPGMAPLPPDGAAGSSAADIAPPDCGCQPSGTFECVVKPVTCQADTDCVAGWHCIKEVAVAEPSCAQGADCAAPTPQPMPLSGSCEPPYYGAHSGSELEAPVSASNGGTTKGGSGAGTTTGSGSGNNGGTPAPEAANDGDGESHESSACQFGRAPMSQGALGVLAMLGALIGLSRRRRAAQG